jgi:hypothetical protein
MKYGIDYKNMNTGIHGLLLYSTKINAEIIHQCLKNNLDKEDFQEIQEDIFANAAESIEEIDFRNLKEVMKNVTYSINENGLVHPVTNNIRIINHGQSLDLYC